MDKVNIAIIGVGVVGLAVAYELSKKNKDIVLLEKETAFGQETSSRNSEIIHAGIYYPKDSLKAKLCVEGNKLLYAFCQENNIPHKRAGKLIVAENKEEEKQLHDLKIKAENNGVMDLEWLDGAQVERMEPFVKATLALFSPSTGMVDSHSLMKCLEQKAKDNGVMFSYASKVTGITKSSGNYIINVNNEYEFMAEKVINSAGLYSDQIASLVGIDIEKAGYTLYYCKGEYFSYSKPSFLKHLVYPVPEHDITGLGVHAVLDLAGSLKFGPNAFYVEKLEYSVDPSHKQGFYESIVKLFPQVKLEDISPDQSGIRPKLQGPGQGIRDFVVAQESEKGLSGFVNLIGIESPGLTASLGIAKQVNCLLK